MLTRNITIALVASLGIHVFAMTAVTIITPEDFFTTEPFTKVTFLGPILEKTAFEMMVEDADPVGKTRYTFGTLSGADASLKISVPKMDPGSRGSVVYYENGMDLMLRDFLAGGKSTPGVMFGLDPAEALMKEWAKGAGNFSKSKTREIIYLPEAPRVMKGLYGQRDRFSARVKAFVGRSGRVIRAETVTTSGYPGLDISAAKYVKAWLFEPSDVAAGEGEWVEVDVTLMTSTDGE